MESKKCFKCGEEKPLSEFYVHKMMKDGYLNKCKECAIKDVRLRRIEHPEILAEYEKKRLGNDERRAYVREHAKRWQEKYPERKKAHQTLQNALRDKKISKPDSCEVCGCKKKLHAHHYDYSKALEVVWVCVKCHRQLHSK